MHKRLTEGESVADKYATVTKIGLGFS
jgi:hypothetical protein